MATRSLEERVTALEAEVMQLKRAWQGATNMSVPWCNTFAKICTLVGLLS